MKNFNWASVSSAFACGLMLSASLYEYKYSDHLSAVVLMGWAGVNAVIFTYGYFKESK